MEISNDRKAILSSLIESILKKQESKENIRLNFICTHNSRRSQIAQIWAQTAAWYYGVKVECFSGGTEVTAFNNSAVETMSRHGFRIISKGEENPVYFVFHSEDSDPVIAFSKAYDDGINPARNFIAVMTCADADENCPFIPGAETRIPVQYEDPKAFDGTPEEAQKYNERSFQIAAEMFYVFSKIKKS